MYEKIDIFETIEENDIVNEDRERFNPYMIIIEEFCSKHGIIIMCDSLELTKDSYKYNIYPSSNPKQCTIDLCDELYKGPDEYFNKYINGRVKIKNFSYVIEIDFREVVNIQTAMSSRGIKIGDILPVNSVKGIFNNNIKLTIVGELMQLIKYYLILINPLLSSQWIETYHLEKTTRAKFISKNNPTSDLNIKHIDPIVNEILNRFKDVIIVGDVGLELTKNNKIPSKIYRLQVVSDENSKLVEFLKDRKFDLVNNEVKLIFGQTVKKITAIRDSKRIVDLYILGEFVPVPYNIRKAYRVGTPYLLLLCYLLDIWSIKLISALQQNSYLKYINDHTIKQIKQVHELKPEEMFPINNYIGTYVDHTLYLRRHTKYHDFQYIPSKK